MKDRSTVYWGWSPCSQHWFVLGAARPVNVREGIETVMHRYCEGYHSGWRVTEVRSGGHLGEGRTKAQAIEDARRRVMAPQALRKLRDAAQQAVRAQAKLDKRNPRCPLAEGETWL